MERGRCTHCVGVFRKAVLNVKRVQPIWSPVAGSAPVAGRRSERLATVEFLETGNLPFSVTVTKDGAHSGATKQPTGRCRSPTICCLCYELGTPRPHYDVL